MARSSGVVILTVCALAVALVGVGSSGSTAGDTPPAEPKAPDPALNGSTISALLDANGGKVPATGEELVKALDKLGKFAQLPVVFSAVRLDSGVGNPRVVITPVVTGLSDAEVTGPSLIGRLCLAATMEKDPKGGDPRVTSVEFISWNTLRRRFDFGVIEDMGSDEVPQLRVVDGGRCFACHKNKGPILSAAPWTNTTNLPLLRAMVTDKLKVVETVPPGAAGAGKRDRIDGMKLAVSDGAMVDSVVRAGALLQLNRDTFRLMNRSASGRKAFVAMLVVIAEPGVLDPNDREAKRIVELWGHDQSYLRFTTDWVAIA